MTKEEIAEIAEQTSDAYSFDRYGAKNWKSTCAMLAKRGLNAVEVEAVMRSKWTRWAGDMADSEYGNVKAKDLAAYIDKCEPNLKASIRTDLL
jgi:hypothetical protein